MIDVGQTVGNYTVTAKLGEGGMGTVFLAEHPVIGSRVALKAIHPEYARSPEVVSRFVNEARAVNQIGHDHIIDIHDFGTTPAGDFYFIMEYLSGEMLSDQRGRQVVFSAARALNIVAQIADALSASHERGVIHRDLKPDNVFLITRDGRPDFVKVLDFGLAKLTTASGAVPAYTTDAGIVMGTPYYMSPEQCEGRAELDHRSDVYSLGVILFELLTGQVPFAGEGYGEVMTKHISLPAPSARRFVPGLPIALDAILSRALAKDPDARFQTMAELREVLLSTESALSPPPTPVIERDVERALERDPSGPLLLGGASSTPTPPAFSFQQHVGEVGEAVDIRPRRSRGGLFVLGAAAALAAVALANSGVRGQATQLLARTAAPERPAIVRVNFSSDPAGATVSRSDGSVLGVTPLSVEIPYSDKPVDYCLQKDGYSPKVSSFVPNLPSPVFVLLERIPPPAPPPADPATSVASSLAARPPTGVPGPARARAPRESRHRFSAERLRELVDDGDDVMPPSTQ
jgi:eukaryotic-like serine/threonine-protein kinase